MRFKYFFYLTCFFLILVCGKSYSHNISSGHLLAQSSGGVLIWLIVAVVFLLILVVLLYLQLRAKSSTISKVNNVNDDLANEKYLLDFLMENLPVLIYFKDKDSKFIRFSKYMADYFHQNKEEMMGKTDFDIHDQEHALEAFEHEQNIIRTGKPKINYLEKETHKNGIEKWVSTTKMPLVNARGQVIGTFGISKDVTEVKHQYEELLRREEKIKFQNLKLVEYQEELEAQNEELLQGQEEILSQRDIVAAQNEELIQSQEEISSQRDTVAAQNIKLHEAADIIEKQNEEIRLRNGNLEKEVEKRTKELVEYNLQLEQFAFISAHNLRAPVARILGLGHLLDLLPANTEAEIKEKKFVYDKMVHTSGELDRVVRDLNTILEIKKNSSSVVVSVDLEKELQLIKINLEKEIEETHAQITADFTDVDVIHTVKPYFESILVNLISNSIKYRCPERIPVIHLRTELRGEYVCLIVSDNGLGLDLALHRKKIFTLYNRFHSHVEGKGLGLYLVKTQVTSMGGKIEVESEVGKGITFCVYLKRHSPWM